jgi:hypothetical protein
MLAESSDSETACVSLAATLPWYPHSVNEFLPGGQAWGRASVQTAYGSQTMRGALHNSDQWEQYSTRQYRTALLNRADVEANTERRVELEYSWPGR